MIYFCKIPWHKQESKKSVDVQRAAARKLLLLGLQQEYAIARMPDIFSEDSGKPFFPEYPDICFNYSHCRMGILCGISNHRIGVDVETVREYREKLVKRVCHPQELLFLEEEDDKESAFTKLWVLKEAYTKYTGQGLRTDLRNLEFADIVRKGEGKKNRCFFKLRQYGQCMAAVCSETYWDGEIIQKEI